MAECLPNVVMDQKIKTLQIIYFAILSGLTFIYAFQYKVVLKSFSNINLSDYTFFIFLAIPILTIFISQKVFNITLQNFKSQKDKESHFAMYQTSSIISWAI
jgi:membrane protein YdbS with pleckstrin-like domain